MGGRILAGPLVAEAQLQQTEKVRRIGYLSEPIPSPITVEAFRQGLREHGYVEGRNLLIEWRSADGKTDRLPALAAELINLKVEVIVTQGTNAAPAAKNATALTPIVFTFVADPVAQGLIASLARPGGTITGVSSISVDLTGKRLELLKEAIPSLKSIVLLTHPAHVASASSANEAQIAARQLGLVVRVVEVRDPTELEPALASVAHERATAVAPVPFAFFVQHKNQISQLATKRLVPVVGWNRDLAESGALISYGPNIDELFRRAASHVDKILRGGKPGDLPVEQPTKIELIINLKTAKALGLTIPQSLLLRADQVIE